MYLPSIQYFHDKDGDPTMVEFFCQEGKIWGYNKMFLIPSKYNVTHLTTGKTVLTKVSDIETAEILCEILNEEFPDLEDLERLKQACKKMQDIIDKETKNGNSRTEREMPIGSGAGENGNLTKESGYLDRDQPACPGSAVPTRPGPARPGPSPGRRVITFRRHPE